MIEIKGNLILGIPKTGSQSLAAYIMGRQMPFTHKKYSEYNRSFFNVYALWRDPIERFKSALKFEWMLEQRRKEEQRTVDDMIAKLSNEECPLFFRPQSDWLDEVPASELVLLPFAKYDESLQYIGNAVGKRLDFVPTIHKTEGDVTLDARQISALEDFYEQDYKYLSCLKI